MKLCESDQYAVIGSGYATEQSANAAGTRVKNALTVSLARVRVGADFGDRAAKSFFTADGLNWVRQQSGEYVLNNVHGLMVYETFPKPRFVQSNAQLVRGAAPDVFLSAYRVALHAVPVLSQQEQLSYILFNASFFQATADTRFLLLVMAIEALIEPGRRSVEAQAHVDSLIQQTKDASISEHDRNSMLGTLRWLRMESINQAGRRMVTSRLGDRLYEGRNAADFFTYCYQVRSNLVHGNLPIPSFELVGSIAAPLEVFVSDLLTIPLLGPPS